MQIGNYHNTLISGKISNVKLTNPNCRPRLLFNFMLELQVGSRDRMQSARRSPISIDGDMHVLHLYYICITLYHIVSHVAAAGTE